MRALSVIVFASSLAFASCAAQREEEPVGGMVATKQVTLLDHGWGRPDVETQIRKDIWATFHRVPRVPNKRRGVPLVDLNGRELVRVSKQHWCRGAMQGVLQVYRRGKATTYNFAGRGDEIAVDCTEFFPKHKALGFSRFKRAKGEFGDGVRGMSLVPYRSIAVDPKYIPYGSVVFIPSARGTEITLPSGKKIVHDGYFYAATAGGSIDGNHIDVFVGPAVRSPFKFVQSKERHRVAAYIINAPDISAHLAAQHKAPGSLAQLDKKTPTLN